MARAFDTAFTAMCSAIAAIVFFEFLEQLPYSGTTASAEAPTPRSAVKLVLPLAATATVAMFAAVVLVFRHLNHASAGDRRLSELVTFMFCVSAGILQYVFFVQPAGFFINVGAQARAIGLAAATATFFLGMALALVHVSAGGGGRVVDVAGDGPVVRVLSKVAFSAAAALVGIMVVMSLYTTY